MHYRLRTLLILLALGPPLLALGILVAARVYYVVSVVPGIKGLS